MVDITEFRLNDSSIDELFEYCIGNPSKEKVDKIILEYFKDKGKHIYCYKQEEKTLGFIGILDAKQSITITHIAVGLKSRGLGIGKKLVEHVINQYSHKRIIAETDDDAVNFYEKVGFEVHNLTEEYQGITRYKCIKEVNV